MTRVLLLSLLALAGCASQPELPQPPTVVTVTVDRYIKLPADLTADCGNDEAREQTYGEAKRLALVRDEFLDECTGRMQKLRKLGGTEAQP